MLPTPGVVVTSCFAMRIRKGHRWLPLAPGDSTLTLQQARWTPGAKGEATVVGDMIGSQCHVRLRCELLDMIVGLLIT